MSCPPRPVICCTADTRPAANSPCPATIARGGADPEEASLLIVFLKVLLQVGTTAHLSHEPFIEALGGIDAAVLEQVVHGDDFGDHGDVLSRVERHAHHRDADIKDYLGVAVQARAVDWCVV